MHNVDAQLIKFARWVIAEHSETFADVDGDSIQYKLEDLGLLVRVRVEAPCGYNCNCAEYTDKWPTECLRLAEGVKSVSVMKEEC